MLERLKECLKNKDDDLFKFEKMKIEDEQGSEDNEDIINARTTEKRKIEVRGRMMGEIVNIKNNAKETVPSYVVEKHFEEIMEMN